MYSISLFRNLIRNVKVDRIACFKNVNFLLKYSNEHFSNNVIKMEQFNYHGLFEVIILSHLFIGLPLTFTDETEKCHYML